MTGCSAFGGNNLPFGFYMNWQSLFLEEILANAFLLIQPQWKVFNMKVMAVSQSDFFYFFFFLQPFRGAFSHTL